MTEVQSIYVHVPFCAHKCEYCAFFSEASSGALMTRYTHALVRELELVAPELRPRTSRMREPHTLIPTLVAAATMRLKTLRVNQPGAR